MSGNLRLTIYNMLGEEISVLEEGYKAQGYHTANFNGNNLPSGIYIYRLNTGTINLTRKMILLK
ncbi:MAG TPA: T9SS type A sorting domain-containing protein [Ignavibacteriales bacterium]|nr:T9SS type A sorting domain-containing protein [Ignavibacteriales bacterium]